MSSGLYSGASGLALGTGLYKGISGLWSGASGLITGFGGGFTPASLFAAGESGYWLDPSDFSTMWRDSQGVTPVTATGQTVGLLLDKSIGTRTQVFDDANVTFGGTAGYAGRVSPGVYEYARDASSLGQVLFGGLTAGRTYLVSLQLSAYAGAIPGITGVRADFFNVANASIRPIALGAGTYTFFYLADGSTFQIRSGGGGVGGTISNVSILEVPGNHFLQATAGNRPILGVEPAGGRRNLLTYTEQFDNAAWLKAAATATANAAVAPDGTTTADKITPNAGSVTPYIWQTYTTTASAFAVSFYAKASGYDFIQISDGVSATDYCNFDLATGAVGASSGYAGSITDTGDGWYRCVATKTFTAVSTEIRIEPLDENRASRRPAYTADGTSGVYIWGAQLEVGSTATDYQRVTDQWNVTEAGVTNVYYLQGDGTDDELASVAAVPANASTSAQQIFGLRTGATLTGAIPFTTRAFLASGSNVPSATPGSMGLRLVNFGATPSMVMSGVDRVQMSLTSVAAGTKYVYSLLGDISAPSMVARRNATPDVSNTTSLSGGTFIDNAPFILSGGTTGFFPGRLYQAVMRFGPNLSADQLYATETYVNSKTGAY